MLLRHIPNKYWGFFTAPFPAAKSTAEKIAKSTCIPRRHLLQYVQIFLSREDICI